MAVEKSCGAISAGTLGIGCTAPKNDGSTNHVGRLLLAFRVRPESSCWIAQFSQHEPDGGQTQEGEALAVQALPVLGEPSAPAEPCEGALHDPSLRQDYEAFRRV